MIADPYTKIGRPEVDVLMVTDLCVSHRSELLFRKHIVPSRTSKVSPTCNRCTDARASSCAAIKMCRVKLGHYESISMCFIGKFNYLEVANDYM